MADKNHYNISRMTFNVNYLNMPIKITETDRTYWKHGLTICCLQDIHFKDNDNGKKKVKGWGKGSFSACLCCFCIFSSWIY